jgi:ribosomal protein S18 acetylase RimI-like enzyme
MEDLAIREVSEKDVKSCAKIEAICFSKASAASEEKIAKRFRVFPEGFIIAELKGEIIGFINSALTNKNDISDEALKDMTGHEADGKNAVVFSLAVSPAHQGKGISHYLLRNFEEKARNWPAENILLLCKNELVRYYEKFGYEDQGESASTHGGDTWHQMRLRLG